MVGSSVRPPAHEHRERQARTLATREGADQRIGHGAAEVEVTEVSAQLEFAGGGLRAREVLQRRLVGSQLLELVLREIADHEPVACEASSRERRQFTGDGLDQRRLACAVGAEQPEACARLQCELQVLDDRRPARITERRVLERQQRRRRAFGWRDLEVERRIDVCRGDALQAIERLEAALRLPCLAGLGTEARDEPVDVGDLALLALEHRLLDGQSCRALLLERRVVARVEREPAPLDVRDVRYAGVEEVPVV